MAGHEPGGPVLRNESPNLRALDLLISVVKLGSLAAAARAHGISQPSASSRMQHLERTLGFHLLHRTTAGSVPTEAGAKIAGWALELLGAARRFDDNVSAMRSSSAAALNVAASYTVAEYLLPEWLHRLERQRLRYAVAVAVMNSALVASAVRGGTADLGFVESPADLDDLNQKVVACDELVVVVAPNHPWASQQTVAAEDLSTTPLALQEPGSGTRDALGSALASAGLPAPLAAVELGSTSALISAAVLGVAPTVISRLAAENELQSGRLVAVTASDLRLSRSLRAIWRADTTMSVPAAELLEQIGAGSTEPS